MNKIDPKASIIKTTNKITTKAYQNTNDTFRM